MRTYSNLCVTNYIMQHDLLNDDTVWLCGATMRGNVWYYNMVRWCGTMMYDNAVQHAVQRCGTMYGTMMQYDDVVRYARQRCSTICSTMMQYDDAERWCSTMYGMTKQYNDAVRWRCSATMQYGTVRWYDVTMWSNIWLHKFCSTHVSQLHAEWHYLCVTHSNSPRTPNRTERTEI
jgi:hypothetical protein